MEKIMRFEEIDDLAKKIAEYVGSNTVIALIGDLGTGKTTFTKTFAKHFGILENIKSPTFNYVLEYNSGRLPLYHFDVYRLCSGQEIYEIGYEDYINAGGVSLIEWANIIDEELPKEYIEIKFSYLEEEKIEKLVALNILESSDTIENIRVVSLKYIGNQEKEKEMLKYVDFSD